MKILYKGNIKKEKEEKFSCKQCDCVWLANEGEYIKEDINFYEGMKKCKCPCCGSIALKLYYYNKPDNKGKEKNRFDF